MESVAVFGSCVSTLRSPSTERNGGLSYTHKLNLRTHYLAAFNPSSLYSFSPRLSHAKMRSKKNKSHIFLPHLVASMEEVEETYVMVKPDGVQEEVEETYIMVKPDGEEVEETYIMVKPDGVQRGLVGEIISRFEKKGFKLTGLKLFECPKELAEEHYKDLNAKPFFPKLIQYITSGPVVCMAWEGVGVVASARKLIGATNPLQAEPGTIRGDLAVQTGRNVVHGSDSPENGKREIGLWFKEGEICQWTPALAPWLME